MQLGDVTTWRGLDSRRRRATQARTVASATLIDEAIAACGARSRRSHSRMITYGPSFGARLTPTAAPAVPAPVHVLAPPARVWTAPPLAVPADRTTPPSRFQSPERRGWGQFGLQVGPNQSSNRGHRLHRRRRGRAPTVATPAATATASRLRSRRPRLRQPPRRHSLPRPRGRPRRSRRQHPPRPLPTPPRPRFCVGNVARPHAAAPTRYTSVSGLVTPARSPRLARRSAGATMSTGSRTRRPAATPPLTSDGA